jgi:eukaryotic-like serine/threonine-protein kinase
VAALERYGSGKNVKIELDPAYLDSLAQGSEDISTYTKLWLEALIAPPRRERLLPLAAGLALQEGEYKVEKALGRGGQGSAYLAVSRSGEQVVLKEYILPVFVDTAVRKQAIANFNQEAATLASMHSEHIVRVLDTFIEDQRAYLVLEYVQGDNLRQLMQKKGSLLEIEFLNLAGQLAEALSYLHGLTPPVVHQDFTPDNLILSQSGTVKLIDFMVARRLLATETVTSTVVGKHHYMCPEQFRGRATVQSDIYAFGCTLYFLLTGRDPEPLSTSYPQRADPGLSSRICAIVEKATRLDCEQRYKSMAEVQCDLADISDLSKRTGRSAGVPPASK